MNRRSLFQMLFGAAVAPLVPALPAVAQTTSAGLQSLVGATPVAVRGNLNNPPVMPAEMTEMLRKDLNEVFAREYSHVSYGVAFALFKDESELDLNGDIHDRIYQQLQDSLRLSSHPRLSRKA